MVTLIGKQRHVMPILLGQSYDMVEAAMSFCMKVLLSISSLSKIQKDKACSFWKTASDSDEVSSDCDCTSLASSLNVKFKYYMMFYLNKLVVS
jgi:hypothetical protein